MGGIFDAATDWGYERTPEDFGQTLASWGLGEGPFLMLPLLGPSNPRDAVGFGVELVTDPMGFLLTNEAGLARSITSGVSQRAAYLDELESVESTSVDFYAALRELYRSIARRRSGTVRLRQSWRFLTSTSTRISMMSGSRNSPPLGAPRMRQS